jgi:hypothetical protein
MTDIDDKATNEVGTWLDEIARAKKSMHTWTERCEKIRKKYRYEASLNAKTRQYQMLWSNMETMKPSVYTKPPKGVVQQRWKDRDPVSRNACELLERGVNFTLDANDYNTKLEQVRDDYLLYARGCARVKYKPEFDTVDKEDGQLDDASIDPAMDVAQEAKTEQAEEDAESKPGEPKQILKFENINMEYVQRADFVHSISRTWEEVTWVDFICYMSRDELLERFEEDIAKAIPLDAGPDRPEDGRSVNNSQADDKATIHEIWDKAKNRVLWIAKGYPDVLEEGPPYLKFEGFYPCPKPAYGTLTNDSLEPVPDYVFYKDQCDEIDTLTARISSLTEMLKLVGFYPAGPAGEGAPEIERAVIPGFENKMIAVKSWAIFSEGAKGGAPIIWLPIDHVSAVLEACVKLRQQLIEDVYQIYGLSDIMRGDGKASETATAQNIKAQYGSVRIRERQNELARFCRDLCRLVGEILASQFQPETLLKMANMKLPTQAELDAKALQEQIAALQAQAQQSAMMGQAQGGPPMGMNQGPSQQLQAGGPAQNAMGMQ